MRHFLGLIGIVAFAMALGTCSMAATGLRDMQHNVAGMVLVLIGVVSFGLASIIEELQDLAKKLGPPKPPA